MTDRLLSLSVKLNEARNMNQVVEAVLGHLREEAYGVVLALHDPRRQRLQVRYMVNYDEAVLAPYLDLSLDARLPLADVFRSGQPLILTREACHQQYPTLLLAPDTQEMVALPLVASGQVLGVVLLSLREVGTVTAATLGQFALLVNLCASALERARLYEQVVRNETRYRTLLETDHAVLWETDAAFEIQEPMPAWESFSGQPWPLYRAQGYLGAVHRDDQGAVRQALLVAGQTGRPLELRCRLMNRTGRFRHMSGHLLPVRGEDGSMQAWIGTLRDITEKRWQQHWDEAAQQLLRLHGDTGLGREIYERILAEMMRVAGSSRGLLAGTTGQDLSLRTLCAVGLAPHLTAHFQNFSLAEDTGLAQRATQGGVFWLHDVLDLGRRPDLLHGTLLADQGPVLMVALQYGGKLTALIALAFHQNHLPDTDTLDHLQWLEPRLAPTVHRAQLLYALEHSEVQAQTIVSALDEGVVLTDRRGRVVSVNRAARQLLGLGDAVSFPVVTDPGWGLMDEFGLPVAPHELPAVRALESGEPVRNELLAWSSPGGRTLWLSITAIPLQDDQGIQGVVVSFSDVTEAHLLRQELSAQALRDDLTGLLNRRTFHGVLHGTAQLARTVAAGALLLVDIDHFKAVNDVYGHPAGDLLLRTLAERLTQVGATQGLAARLGGDEFGLILSKSSSQEAERLASDLVRVLAEPLVIEGAALRPTVSIGVCVVGQATTPEQLYLHADLALQEAKRSGRDRWYLYTPALAADQRRRLQIERRLRRALAAGELSVHYQPLVDLKQPEWSAFEALARWQDAELGWVSPAEFVPVAEASGLINDLGQAVLMQALAQAVTWRRQLHRPVSVSVNVSATQLMLPSFPATVAQALADTGAEASQLTLELTEAVVIQDTMQVTRQLHLLREMGVQLALDDFGTGYSSLSVLQTLPIQRLKIDRSFVRNVHHDPRRQALLSAIILLGRELGIQIVAEGVEEQAELNLLEALGCTQVQGYYFSRPAPAETFFGEAALT